MSCSVGNAVKYFQPQSTNKQTNKQTQSAEDVGYLADACLSECVVVVAGIARYK